MSNAPVRIIQITDTHLLAAANGVLLGVNTQESFQVALDLIQQNNEKIDFILHTGDMSQDGSKESYLRASNTLKSFNVPVYYAPGNHDNVEVMTAVFPHERIICDSQIVVNNWNIILLNSQKPGKVEGFFHPTQLQYLEICLQKYPQYHALIAFHHHPIPVGSAWLDQLGVKNPDDFWQLVARYPQVSTVLFGHVHQELAEVHQGINCYATPSTCIQFKRKQDQFGLEKLAPGYRWIHLHADGRIETGIKRAAAYVGIFDEKAKGY